MDTIPRTSGIYKIVCAANGKIYIGSAVNLQRRKYWHWGCLRAGKHKNSYLQNAWNKYGEASFKFEIVELVLSPCLLEREQYYFDKLRPHDRSKGFNICINARSPYGMKHSEQSRRNMSEGQKRSLASGRRAELLGVKRPPRTEDHRQKMSQAMKGRRVAGGAYEFKPKTYVVTTPDGEERVISNLVVFCRESGLVRSKIQLVLYGKIEHHRGWKCRYFDG
jgi:group I intron endonuclease